MRKKNSCAGRGLKEEKEGKEGRRAEAKEEEEEREGGGEEWCYELRCTLPKHRCKD